MKCRECKHCKGIQPRPLGLCERGRFYCKHPNQKYIYDYFDAKRMVKQPGFIGFGEKFSDKPSIKTSPEWCPLKAESSS